MKKGYSAEYDAKKKLIQEYGKYSVVKTAIGQNAPDYIVFADCIEHTPRVKGVEIKSTQSKKYYTHEHDIEQVKFFIEWKKATGVPVSYLIRTIVGHKVVWEELTLEEFQEKYIFEGD